MAEPEGFRHFVIARSPGLVRAAWLLTGGLASAEDLVQTAPAKVWSRWAQVDRQDAPEAYVRRVMMSTFLTWNRRRWHTELAVGDLPDTVEARNDLHEVELRWSVAHALRSLPRRQRAVIVLRCQRTLRSAQWRSGILPAGGHKNCPVVAMGSALAGWPPPVGGQFIGVTSPVALRSLMATGSSQWGQLPPLPTRRVNRLQSRHS